MPKRCDRAHWLAWVLCAAWLAFAPPAWSWGPEGHAIAADIAEARLTPAARAEVTALLAIEGATALDQVSSWADAIRRARPETAGWHFVDIPLAATAYDPARDCPDGNCAIAQFDRFAAVLADRGAAPADRLVALKWVVHLAGDIHQPLHAEDHDDAGGNRVRETFAGRKTNLHAVWDTFIIEQQTGMRLGPHFSFDHAAARRAAETIAAAGAPETATGTAADWAMESHALAQAIYRDLPAGGALPEDYAARNWPAVTDRLRIAGMRLAAALNGAMGGGP